MIETNFKVYLAFQNCLSNYSKSKFSFLWNSYHFILLLLIKVFLFSYLLKLDFFFYCPYLAIGLFNWLLFSSLLSKFLIIIHNNNFIVNTNIDINDFLVINFFEILIIQSINFLILIFILIFFKIELLSLFYLLFVTFFIIKFYFEFIKIAVLIGTYLPNLGYLVRSSLFCIYFITPIFWYNETIIKKYYFFFVVNPLYHILELFRSIFFTNKIIIPSFFFLIIFTTSLILINRYLVKKYLISIRNYI